MTFKKHIQRGLASCSLIALGSFALISGANADTSQPGGDETVDRLEELGLDPKPVDEQLDIFESGGTLLSMTDATPVETFESEITEDGRDYYETILYYEDDTYTRSLVEQSPEISTRNYVTGCTQSDSNRANYVNSLGCSAEWDNGVLFFDATVDYGLRAGSTYGGEMLDVYGVSVISAGGTVAGVSTAVTRSFSETEGSPARAETSFTFEAFEPGVGQSGTIVTEVRSLGAFVSGPSSEDPDPDNN